MRGRRPSARKRRRGGRGSWVFDPCGGSPPDPPTCDCSFRPAILAAAVLDPASSAGDAVSAAGCDTQWKADFWVLEICSGLQWFWSHRSDPAKFWVAIKSTTYTTISVRKTQPA